ncbi:MAG: BPSL0067 family protein [Prochlorotrichaceae cyanobacterium]
MSHSFSENTGSFSVPTGLPSQFDRDELLDQALQGLQNHLHQLALSGNGYQTLDFVFDITTPNAVHDRLTDWGNRIFPNMPNIVVLEDVTMKGAFGAFSTERNTIYLSESLVQRDNLTGLEKVLTEEYGHFLDTQFNPAGDSAGDEGELLSKVTLGEEISDQDLARLRGEDDRGFLNINGANVAVEFDNSTGTAYNIGTLSGTRSYSGFVGSSDTNDYYRFSVANTSNFSLNLTGLSADAEVALLDGNGGTIVSSTNGGSRDESISRQLNAGTYYARVYPFSSANTNYNLSLTANSVGPTDNAGNSTGAARNIGTLIGTQNFSDFVGSADTNDYYRFSIANTSNFSLGLTGLSADAEVALLDANGSTIVSSTNGGSRDESISRQLNAGTYYARVYPFSSANTNYNLSLTANSVGPTDNAGNSTGAARNIGTLIGTQNFSDFVGSADTNDYYRFSIANTSNFSLGLTGLSADAEVALLDANGSTIVSSTNGGSSNENISRQLNAGTYYARVYPFGSANTNYNLSLTANSVGLTDNAGNSTGSARNIGTLSGTQNFSDFVGSADTNDYYRFSIANTSNFSLGLTGLSADAEVALLDANGSTIVSSTNSGSTSESITRQLNAGNYYARVYQYSGNTNYNLSLTANTLSTPPTVSPSALRTTSSNLAALIGGSLNGRYIEADGAYLYQCVDLVKDMTDTERITTSNWRRGENVIQNRSVAQGSSIAIFDSAGRYNHRHTAIFDRYDTVNNSFGFWAWSQNFPTGSGVRRHFIPVNGSSSGNNDADEYHVILPL